jgi:hypothetical protein
MFKNAKAFNQPIVSTWTLGIGTLKSLEEIFAEAENFDQDLSKWDMRYIENVKGMLSGAKSFDQSLSGWDIRNLLNVEHLLTDTDLSVYNYNALLDAWSKKTINTNNAKGIKT